jgi:hypothetical protein
MTLRGEVCPDCGAVVALGQLDDQGNERPTDAIERRAREAGVPAWHVLFPSGIPEIDGATGDTRCRMRLLYHPDRPDLPPDDWSPDQNMLSDYVDLVLIAEERHRKEAGHH